MTSEFANIFDTEAERYDSWFDSPEGRVLFENELAAIRLLWRDEYRPAVEIGVGTGRFAHTLGVEFGIDPAAGPLRLAQRRGINVRLARGEALPFADSSFGGVLMIATLCFVENAFAVFREAARVLRADGRLLIGEIPKDSIWGQHYLAKKQEGNPFYRDAHFYTSVELETPLLNANLEPSGFASTLIKSQPGYPVMESPRSERILDAGFVCVLARKA